MTPWGIPSLAILLVGATALADPSAAQTVVSVSTTPQAPDVPAIDYRGMRDPFKAPEWHETGDTKTPLEMIPVTDFTLVAVLTGPQKSRALVRAKGGLFTISVGTKIGVQHGYVRSIDSDRVVVVETLVDLLGEKETSVQEIRLAPMGGGPGDPNSGSGAPQGLTPFPSPTPARAW